MPGGGNGLITVPELDPARLGSAIVRDTTDHFLVVDGSARVVACNPTLLEALGYPPDELLGRPVLDLLDPRDLERAAYLLPHASDEGSPGGVSAFRLVRRDGEVVTANVAGDTIVLDDERYMLLRGRPVWWPQAVDALLDGLLDGAPRQHLLAQVLECFAWREDGSQVAISWQAEDGLAEVDTGLDRRLTGVDADTEPWATARRTGAGFRGEVAALPAPVAELAADQGLTSCWIEAVDGPGASTPVLVTAFGSRPGFPVDALHLAAMHQARRYIQVILRWTDQLGQLEAAALHDPLTGLANRRRFLEAVDQDERGGAVLYCDLDAFKPVNDRWGHGVGDAVLVQVGRRLAALVRQGDLVARVGGDEFAVILWGAQRAEAEGIAERIREVCGRPIAAEGAVVSIGISVGVAASDGRLHPDVVTSADAALYQEKAARRGPG